MKFIFIFIFATSIFANIKSYIIKSDKKYTNITLVFDKKFTKDVSISKLNDTNLIIIDDKAIFSNKKNDFENDFLGKVNFVKTQDKTHILFNTKNKVKITIKRIKGNKELILKIKKDKFLSLNQNKEKPLKLKESTIGFKDYMLSATIIIVVLIIYFILKIKVLKIPSNSKNINYKVLFQKSLDIKTKISMIEIENKKYLLLTGTNHSLLLDKFNNTIDDETNEKFKKIMEEI